ncbi:MAG: 3-phosphoshikimate 1-carboxyvinyltransferase [Butyrivibrio sp.]|nr:3-phosphoshikimate 1-carboxyvinyltransferase [Acetatifactor muris]MCM1560282.1 3-phosphoshikimate 1-carboxyvinyltransferase [Butyrivibrio sp.]
MEQIEYSIYQVPCIYKDINRQARAGKDSPAPLTVSVPGSKSITNRALLLATLAEGRSTLRDVLFSDDSRHFLKCIRDLGFETSVDEENKVITVTGTGGAVPAKEASLYVGSAGTAARFLTAYLGLSEGVYHMDASEQMRKRPMTPLLDSLAELGCEITFDGEEGHFPFTLKGRGFGKNRITVNIEKSSQFMSGLLIASCLSGEDFLAVTEGFHGMAYIEMTVKMMQQFGVTAVPQYYCGGQAGGHDCSGCVNSTIPYAYRIPAGQRYRALDYRVQPDVSAACYFYALSPLLGIPVQVRHIHRGTGHSPGGQEHPLKGREYPLSEISSPLEGQAHPLNGQDRPLSGQDFLQGDIAFLQLLEEMGCRAEDRPEGVLLLPPEDGIYHGIHADMSAFSDQAITLAALAPFADGPTTITGIGHIRCQESDRITAIVTELGKMGIRCQETEDSITIYPGNPSPTAVETYDDHRMAMGFSLIGLRSEGIVIRNPGCCRKTFENYFQVLDGVIAELPR